MVENKLRFPKDFFWGAATASHQVEGNTNNNWSNDTKLHFPKNAEEALKHYKKRNRLNGIFDQEVWNIVKDDMLNEKLQSKVSLVNHDENYQKDFDLAKSLNHNMHRFSIEWSRIEPEEGKFNQEAIGHYKDVVRALKGRNIEPMVTLWHFSLPVWFEKKGGWTKKSNVKYFTRYTERIAEEFGGDIKYWITINEPLIYSLTTYLSGEFPPHQKLRPLLILKSVLNLVSAHKNAYRKIKSYSPDSMVSLAKHQSILWTTKINPLGWFSWLGLNYFFNCFFLDRVKNHLDYIGMNFYMVIDGSLGNLLGYHPHDLRNRKKGITGLSDLGWYLYPKGIYDRSKYLWKKYKKPIIVTEHGLADKLDRLRGEYISESLNWLNKAIEEGVGIKGYLYWSLLDNLEWTDGHWPRFGLIEVDYETGKRKVRDSAKSYSKLIEQNQNLIT